MVSGPQTKNVGSPSLNKDARLSSEPLGVDMADGRDGSWNRLCFTWLYFAAKHSHVGVDVDRVACFLHHPTVCGWQTKVQSLMARALSCRAAMGSDAFPGGAKPWELDMWCGVDRPGTWGTESYMKNLTFTIVYLSSIRVIIQITSSYIRRWWNEFQYSSTYYQALVGACGHVLLRQALNVVASRDPGASKAFLILKAPGWSDWVPGLFPGGGERQNGLTSGEILSAHDYRNGGRCWHVLLLGLVLFRLVAPPLQSGVVDSYPVRGAWFSKHLLLEGTSRIQIFRA
jgi:hypothetical protein